MADVVHQHGKLGAGLCVRRAAQSSTDGHIQDEKKWIVRVAERPCVAGLQVRCSYHEKGLSGIVHIELDHVGGPDLAVDVKRRVHLLAAGKRERAALSVAGCNLRMNG